MKFRKILLLPLLFSSLIGFSQVSKAVEDSTKQKEEAKKRSPFVSGYYPVGFFDIDLKYLVKYNNYESFRLGFGGVTNERLFKDFKIGGYAAYGFKDDAYKYSLGGNVRISKKSNDWVSLYYTKDIREIGSYEYLTSARVYSVFEPRLINITQFYKHRTWRAGVMINPSDKFISEFRISHQNIQQIEAYQFLYHDEAFSNYKLLETTLSLRYAPKTNEFISESGTLEHSDGLPKISIQVTRGIKGISESNFNYTKAGVKLDYHIKRMDLSSSHFVLEGVKAWGNAPLTHLFHAYPNSPTKEEILQRFSVAGIQSFETMYFGEFFSSELVTFRAKHTLRRFRISEKIKPELVFITRHALGDLDHLERHLGIGFKTLSQLYSESGLEFNKMFFGFGLSFAYRYGYYHLPDFEDNVSFKFTFNLKL